MILPTAPRLAKVGKRWTLRPLLRRTVKVWLGTRSTVLGETREAHQQIVGIVKGGLLIVKGREAHALEVPPISLLAAHHDPHGAPLRHVHGLDDPWDLVHEADGSSDVVQHLHIGIQSYGRNSKHQPLLLMSSGTL